MRWNLPLLVVVACLVAGARPAWAQDAEDPNAPVFTVVVEEPSESPPPAADFYDVVEVAIAEPGDGTFVLRGTLAGAPADSSVGVLYFGFTTDAGDIVGGCTYGGVPDTRNIGEPIAPDACVVSGNVIYATYAYETAETGVGQAITQTWAFSDMCLPAGCLPGDSAPGGDGSVGPNGWNAGVYGLDYQLTGCSRAVCAGASPVVEALNGSTVAAQLSFENATSGARAYVWNTNLTAARVEVVLNGTGRVGVRVTDGNGTELVNRTLTSPGNLTEDVGPAMPGNWSVNLMLENVTGNATLRLGAVPEEPEQPTESSTSTTTGDDDRTGTFPLVRDDRGSPSLVPAATVLVLGAIAMAMRRRLG